MSPSTVLHFIPAIGGGGAEAMLCNLVEAMDRQRWRSIVVTLNAKSWPQAEQRLRQAGAEIHDLDAPAFLRWPVLSQLVALIRRLKPDIVQTWMHHADLVGGWCARIAGVRNIVWGIHCREIHRNPGDSEGKVALFVKALALSSRILPRRIISCSAVAMADHEALGYARRKMLWIPNGIRTDQFVPDAAARQRTREELALPQEAPVIGFVGRFHEMKNLPLFFAAVKGLQARMAGVHWVLCGSTVEELDAVSLATYQSLPAPQQVHFVPFRPDPQALYPALDVFTLTSRTEACPMTIMEAMACGVPCVTTDVGDCARLIAETGSTVPSGDAVSLADAWQQALSESPVLKSIRQTAARQRAEEVFAIQQAASAYSKLYEEVLQ